MFAPFPLSFYPSFRPNKLFSPLSLGMQKWANLHKRHGKFSWLEKRIWSNHLLGGRTQAILSVWHLLQGDITMKYVWFQSQFLVFSNFAQNFHSKHRPWIYFSRPASLTSPEDFRGLYLNSWKLSRKKLRIFPHPIIISTYFWITFSKKLAILEMNISLVLSTPGIILKESHWRADLKPLLCTYWNILYYNTIIRVEYHFSVLNMTLLRCK